MEGRESYARGQECKFEGICFAHFLLRMTRSLASLVMLEKDDTRLFASNQDE